MNEPNKPDYTKSQVIVGVVVLSFILLSIFLAGFLKEIFIENVSNIFFWIAAALIFFIIIWTFFILKLLKNVHTDFQTYNHEYQINLDKLNEIILYLSSEASVKYFRLKNHKQLNVYPISYLSVLEKEICPGSYIFYDRPFSIENQSFSALKTIMKANETRGIIYKTFDNTTKNNTFIPESLGFVVYADKNIQNKKSQGFPRQKNVFTNEQDTDVFLINVFYIIPLTKTGSVKNADMILAVKIISEAEIGRLLDFIKTY